jgi:hypothetical protein
MQRMVIRKTMCRRIRHCSMNGPVKKHPHKIGVLLLSRHKSEMKTFNQIWEFVGGARIFRIRDVQTLRDYLVLKITSYTQQRPHHIITMSCEGHDQVTQTGNESKWLLLSQPDEIEEFRHLSEEQAVKLVKQSYRRALP